MHTCSHHHQIGDAPRRVDPTKTTTIRRRYEREMVRRFRALKALIRQAIVERNVLGLGSTTAEQALNAQIFARTFRPDSGRVRDQAVAPGPSAFNFPRSSDKIAAFMEWLKEAQSDLILGVQLGTPVRSAAEQAWQNVYIDAAYQKGIREAGDKLRKAGATVEESWVSAGFNRPIHADRVGVIYTRAFADLAGIAEAMDTQISRVLAQGLAEGLGPMVMARRMAERVDAIGVTRARVIARTETIHAHAEASLNSYREAGIEGVSAEVEFLTAQDEQVCPECEALEGRIFSLAEAEGIIPVHPNCRCAWAPHVPNAEELLLQ
jgi:SPP1 gp7 family putative phage head morphogenesis protein